MPSLLLKGTNMLSNHINILAARMIGRLKFKFIIKRGLLLFVLIVSIGFHNVVYV